ncbi:hypothetical protein RIF29_26979 [Crotalaria pallida]|uniref:Legumain prodomain domain-containing protein n=1 Tax=Crotalaria pallida TaxID=3830 RepID=A0AAN9I0M7_CROPI
MLEGVGPMHEVEVELGKRWAILVAGSQGYWNYRHQADVCHAYQILKKGGLKDENIIVFMYDDIAFNSENPRPGTIINKPNGPDVYKGVPKDYTGDDANVENFYAVISGNRSGIHGGSGKVVDSAPNDFIFIYYSDHGGSGSLVMANQFVEVLKKKHAANAYKKMVIYVEACEAGSMFEGLLPNDINIYATTASNGTENSYADYCPETFGSDKNDMRKETLKQQYETVKRRTLSGDGDIGHTSHVMQFGDIKLNKDILATYFGANPTNVNDSSTLITSKLTNAFSFAPSTTPSTRIDQRDVRLLYLRLKLEKALNGSKEKIEAQKELAAEIAHREHVDKNVQLIGELLFGKEKSSIMMANVRPTGQPLVDDWDCFKTIMKTYESNCGTLSTYGKKYSKAFANMCNTGISEQKMATASSQACPKENTLAI